MRASWLYIVGISLIVAIGIGLIAYGFIYYYRNVYSYNQLSTEMVQYDKLIDHTPKALQVRDEPVSTPYSPEGSTCGACQANKSKALRLW